MHWKLSILALVALMVAVASADEGLVAHWDFSEGKGDMLHDRSGNENHGKVHGAKWVRNGAGYALEFDGVDDYVDCGVGPSLDFRDKVSLEAWVKCGRRDIGGEWGIVGKSTGSYFITRYKQMIWTYISGGGHNTKALGIHDDRWYHFVSTYDGKTLKIYVDGRLAGYNDLNVKINEGGQFWIARKVLRPADAKRYKKEADYFKGTITDVRVYHGALTEAQVARQYLNSNVTNTPLVTALPVSWKRTLLVEADTRGLGAAGADATVAVEVFTADTRTGPVLKGAVTRFDARRRGCVEMPGSALAPGRYDVVATASKPDKGKIGIPGRGGFMWPDIARYPRGPAGARKLNNLVTELLNVPDADDSGRAYTFTNPRRGWIFISNNGAGKVELSGEASPKRETIALVEKNGEAHEAMRLLPAGAYTIRTPSARHLIVRAVPHLIFARYSNNPLIPQFGRYQGAFHKKYVFKNANTFIGREEEFRKEWKARGGRWVVHCSVPRTGADDKPITVDEAVAFLLKQRGFKDPYADGPIADEFGSSEPHCAVYAKALDKIFARPKYKHKVYYPYAGNLWTGKPGMELVRAVMEHDCAIAWERYLGERRTLLDAVSALQSSLVGDGKTWAKRCPGSLPYLIVNLGYFSTPPIQLDKLPHVNYKTWLEMQFNVIANDPALDGVGGLELYNCAYVDPELCRLGVQLYRHYAIEGRTDMLGSDPYILTHIENPDFEQQGEGWTVRPAVKGGIAFSTIPGLGRREGRYPRSAIGDAALITRRCPNRPNLVSQEIKNLKPGQLYNLRMFGAGRKQPKKADQVAAGVKLDNVTLIPAKCFTSVPPRQTMTYFWRVFRAKGATARITISDWASDDKPGGPIGQDLVFNFIQVQP